MSDTSTLYIPTPEQFMRDLLTLKGGHNAIGPVSDAPVQSDRVSLSHKTGKLVGHGVRFFTKRETKTSALISYWTVETVLTAVILADLSSWFAIGCAIFIWAYGTYALFSAINTLVKERT